MPGRERLDAALEGSGHADGQATAGSDPRTYVDGPEDAMTRAPAEYPEEYVAGRYRRIATDPEACRAMAAEVLDFAFDKLGDGKDIRDLATLANVWLRLAEQAMKAQGTIK